ncbi:MAG: hypothetical protein WCI40_02325 [Verrucomicrobiota bacterium]
MNQPYVVPSSARRDLLIGLAVGLVVMALIIFGVVSMAGGVTGTTLNGKIVAKNFTPFEEKQVTFGKGGVHQRDGDYVLECEAKGRLYLVAVDKETYNATKVGGPYLFPRPKE